MLTDLGWLALLGLVVFLFELGDLLGLQWVKWVGPERVHWIEFLFVTPIAAWLGLRIYALDWSAAAFGYRFLGGLVAFMAGAAYLYSGISVFSPALFPKDLQGPHGPEVYFETAGVLVFLMVWVMYLERLLIGKGRDTGFQDTARDEPTDQLNGMEMDQAAADAASRSTGELRGKKPSPTRHRDFWRASRELPVVRMIIRLGTLRPFGFQLACVSAGMAALAIALAEVLILVPDMPWWIRAAF